MTNDEVLGIVQKKQKLIKIESIRGKMFEHLIRQGSFLR